MLVEAENIINSRPLTHVSLDHNDDEALTPNHFLIGSSGASLPPGRFVPSDVNLRKSWKVSQALADQFWQRWIREYLPTLTRRMKWHQHAEPVREGDIVIIVDEGLPRNRWVRGRIVGL